MHDPPSYFQHTFRSLSIGLMVLRRQQRVVTKEGRASSDSRQASPHPWHWCRSEPGRLRLSPHPKPTTSPSQTANTCAIRAGTLDGAPWAIGNAFKELKEPERLPSAEKGFMDRPDAPATRHYRPLRSQGWISHAVGRLDASRMSSHAGLLGASRPWACMLDTSSHAARCGYAAAFEERQPATRQLSNRPKPTP